MKAKVFLDGLLVGDSGDVEIRCSHVGHPAIVHATFSMPLTPPVEALCAAAQAQGASEIHLLLDDATGWSFECRTAAVAGHGASFVGELAPVAGRA